MTLPYKIEMGFWGGWYVHYECPKCHERLNSPLDDAGIADSCPECSATFTVPGEDDPRVASNKRKTEQPKPYAIEKVKNVNFSRDDGIRSEKPISQGEIQKDKIEQRKLKVEKKVQEDIKTDISNANMSIDPDAKKKLDLRLASGDIDTAEYTQLINTLSNSTTPAPPSPKQQATPRWQATFKRWTTSMQRAASAMRRGSSDEPIAISDSSPFQIDKHITVGETFLIHHGQRCPYADILHVKAESSKTTVNWSTDESSILSFILKNGQRIDIKPSRLYPQPSRMDRIAIAGPYVRDITFSSRFKTHCVQLLNDGFITCDDVRIQRDGMIRRKNVCITMHLAYANGTFGIGYRLGSIGSRRQEYDPHKILVSEKKKATDWTRKKIFFHPTWDVDVIWGIMQSIVEGTFKQ
jgi:hypothetical protein